MHLVLSMVYLPCLPPTARLEDVQQPVAAATLPAAAPSTEVVDELKALSNSVQQLASNVADMQARMDKADSTTDASYLTDMQARMDKADEKQDASTPASPPEASNAVPSSDASKAAAYQSMQALLAAKGNPTSSSDAQAKAPPSAEGPPYSSASYNSAAAEEIAFTAAALGLTPEEAQEASSPRPRDWTLELQGQSPQQQASAATDGGEFAEIANNAMASNAQAVPDQAGYGQQPEPPSQPSSSNNAWSQQAMSTTPPIQQAPPLDPPAQPRAPAADQLAALLAQGLDCLRRGRAETRSTSGDLGLAGKLLTQAAECFAQVAEAKPDDVKAVVCGWYVGGAGGMWVVCRWCGCLRLLYMVNTNACLMTLNPREIGAMRC